MSEKPMSIHDACRCGNLKRVQQLVAEDATVVDLDDQYRWRPVFHAALRKHIDVVKFLIDSGADLSAHDGDVLHYGGEVPDNKQVVELLVRYGALDAHVQPKNDLDRQFFIAVFLANEARVRSLLMRNPILSNAVDGRGDYPLHHAARNGDTNIVQTLIEFGADVHARSKKDHTVLYCAGGHGHDQAVKVLLDAGADVAARFGHEQQTLAEWLAQYPDDNRLTKVAALL